MDPLFCADKVLKTMLKGKTRLPIDFPGGDGYNETYKMQRKTPTAKKPINTR